MCPYLSLGSHRRDIRCCEHQRLGNMTDRQRWNHRVTATLHCHGRVRKVGLEGVGARQTPPAVNNGRRGQHLYQDQLQHQVRTIALVLNYIHMRSESNLCAAVLRSLCSHRRDGVNFSDLGARPTGAEGAPGTLPPSTVKLGKVGLEGVSRTPPVLDTGVHTPAAPVPGPAGLAADLELASRLR